MKEIKSILISVEKHSELKALSLKSGKKIRSITEDALQLYFDAEKKKEAENVQV